MRIFIQVNMPFWCKMRIFIPLTLKNPPLGFALDVRKNKDNLAQKFGITKTVILTPFLKAAKRTTTPEETTFHLLHLSLLREYLDYEFQELRSLPFYNVENIIDDWVLMGFLVGNDFIPHLPNMHINKGALPELYTAYKVINGVLGNFTVFCSLKVSRLTHHRRAPIWLIL